MSPRFERGLLAIGLGLAAVLGLSFRSPKASATPTEPGSLQQGLSSSEACSTCHEFFTPEQLANDGGSVDPWAWRGSMMGNSARDPVFWAGVALAAQDHPTETVACVRCHAPRAFLEGQGSVTELASLTPEQRDGINCDTCHRMIDDGETPPGNARYVLADAPEGEPVPRFGPWSYPMFGPAPQHAWAQDLEFLPSSRMCGTCHDVSTARERVDDRGLGLGVPFNEQRTYSEWLNSDYGEQGGRDFTSCQDCHMPAIEGPMLGCNMFAGQPHDGGGRRHVLVGANASTLRVLKSLYGSAGSGEVDDERYDESIAWTEDFVRTAATLEVAFPSTIDASAGISELAVRVINETGHKLPTGYSEGRVMWLEITARYRGELVWSSGLWDDAQKTIEADPQVRRYEAIAERYADGKVFHLLLNDHWVVDNRIPPKGSQPQLETDPVGDRYALQDDGTWPHFDEHSYAFPGVELEDRTPGEPDELELAVRLLYLINTPEYLQVLVDDNTSNDAGLAAKAAFDAIGGPQPIVLAEQVANVPLVGLIEGGDDESGEGDGEGDDEGESGDSGSGDPANDATNGGCNCRTSTPSGGPLGWLTLLPLLLLRRRPITRSGVAPHEPSAAAARAGPDA